MAPEATTVSKPAARSRAGRAWAEVVPAKTKKVSLDKRLLDAYQRICYNILGKRLDKTPNPVLGQRLRRAGLGVTPGLYEGMMGVTGVLTLVGTIAPLMALFRYVVGIEAWIAYGAGVAGLTAIAAIAAFPFVVGSRIQNRANSIDRELPFSLSELAVLASIGLSPIELVRRMANRPHDAAMTAEFRKVAYKADVQGQDLVTALAETAKDSPSNALRETFWDLANMIHQGGDLDEYLRSQSGEVMDLKRVSQKEFADRLAAYSDMYVTLVLIGVMFLGVGAFLLDAFRSTAGGLSASALLLLLTYGIIPLIVVVLGLVLSTAHQRVD